MFAYLITEDGLRPFSQIHLHGSLHENSVHPIFAVYWTARVGDERALLVVGQFPTHEALCNKLNWSMSPPSLPTHFERFDGVWKFIGDGAWEWCAGELREMPADVSGVLHLNG